MFTKWLRISLFNCYEFLVLYMIDDLVYTNLCIFRFVSLLCLRRHNTTFILDFSVFKMVILSCEVSGMSLYSLEYIWPENI